MDNTIRTFVARCFEDVAERGYVSRAKSLETGWNTTATRAQVAMLSPEPPSTAALEKADAALAWAQALVVDSDYTEKLRALARRGTMTERDAGLAASIVAAYAIAVARAAERAAGAGSQHFGEVGMRETFVLTCTRVVNFSYRPGAIASFVDERGNVAKWFSSNLPETKPGRTYRLKGTVKAHDVYDGVRQTVLSRCAVVGEVTDTASAVAA